MRRCLVGLTMIVVGALCAAAWTVQPASAFIAPPAPPGSSSLVRVGTTTTLALSTTTPTVNATSVTLTATVTAQSGTTAPSGNVTFSDGGTTIATASLGSASGLSATASSTTTFSTTGQHTITATYQQNIVSGTQFNGSDGSASLTASEARAHATQVKITPSTTSLQTNQSATLTATVSVTDGSGAIPTGKVQFYDNSQVLGGKVTLDGSGVATLVATGFTAGSNTIGATYFPDDSTTFSGSNATFSTPISATAPVTVYSTSVTLAPSTTTIQTGQSVTLTAKVNSSGGGVPTGSIAFSDNNQPLGSNSTVGLDASGTATLVSSGFVSGTNVITAKYSGDTTHQTSYATTSISATAPPTAVATTITASISPNPVASTGSATLSVHVQQVGSTVTPPQGSIVTFRNAANGSFIAQASLDANGNGSVVKTGWQAGSYTIVATYVGDSLNKSSSGSFPVTVRPTSEVTVTAPSPTLVYGDAMPTLTPSYTGFTDGDTAASLTTQATCTTSATSTSPPGTYPVTCSSAADIYYTFTYQSGTLTVNKAPLTITPDNKTMTQGDQVPSLTATISGFVNGETLATSDATGSPSCTTTATSASPTGTYPITCTVGTLGSSDYSFTAAGQGTLTITTSGATETTSIAWVGGPILIGQPVTLVGSLFSHWTSLSGKTMTLSLVSTQGSSVSCTATTNRAGFASCSVTQTGPVGPATSIASFAGDSTYAASTGSRNAILYAFPSGGGAFVIGDKSAAEHKSVTFWSSQWWKENDVSDGDTSHSFKGFASSPSIPTIGGTWSTGPGDNPSPPSTIPSYMGVIVTSSASQSRSTISGTVCNIAVVDTTNSGYESNAGHAGTGTIVGSLFTLAPCSSNHDSNGSGDTGNSHGNSGGDSGRNGNSGSGGYNGYGYGSNGSNSPNDYTYRYGGGYSADSHRGQWGYTTCPAL